MVHLVYIKYFEQHNGKSYPQWAPARIISRNATHATVDFFTAQTKRIESIKLEECFCVHRNHCQIESHTMSQMLLQDEIHWNAVIEASPEIQKEDQETLETFVLKKSIEEDKELDEMLENFLKMENQPGFEPWLNEVSEEKEGYSYIPEVDDDPFDLSGETRPFTSHLDSCERVQPGQLVDFRDDFGYVSKSLILNKKDTKLLVTSSPIVVQAEKSIKIPAPQAESFRELDYSWWMDCMYDKWRFAEVGSISSRPCHRLQYLGLGASVSIRPPFQNYWNSGNIIKMDEESGQVLVSYGRNKYWWTHLDNESEIDTYEEHFNVERHSSIHRKNQ